MIPILNAYLHLTLTTLTIHLNLSSTHEFFPCQTAVEALLEVVPEGAVSPKEEAPDAVAHLQVSSVQAPAMFVVSAVDLVFLLRVLRPLVSDERTLAKQDAKFKYTLTTTKSTFREELYITMMVCTRFDNFPAVSLTLYSVCK